MTPSKLLLLATSIAALALGASPASADCGCAAWLLTERVHEGRPTIVITTVCPAKQPKMSIRDPAGKLVPHTLLATHDGYSGNTQYVVSPDQPLAPGTHQIKLASRWEHTTHPLVVVAAAAKPAPPTWTASAKVRRQSQEEFGCGPAKTVEIEAGPDASLSFVELVDDKGTRTSGYVPVTKGLLEIGHGMCSGEFSLVKGRSYTATITLIAPERGTSSTSKTVAFTYAP